MRLGAGPNEGRTLTAGAAGPRRKLIAVVAAAVLIIGGGVAALVGVTQYNAETDRLCEVALGTASDARTAQEASLTAADVALEAVESVELPDGGTSTFYADMSGLDASAATDRAPAVEERPSGAELIAAVVDAQTAIVEADVTDECEDRDQAIAITDASAVATAAAESLDEAVAALGDDFATFQTDESARLAAEKKAAEEAAAAESARLAAEQAAEAERQRQAEQDSYDGGDSYGGGGDGNGGGGGGGGGGLIVPPHGGGGCPPGTTFQGEGCS